MSNSSCCSVPRLREEGSAEIHPLSFFFPDKTRGRETCRTKHADTGTAQVGPSLTLNIQSHPLGQSCFSRPECLPGGPPLPALLGLWGSQPPSGPPKPPLGVLSGNTTPCSLQLDSGPPTVPSLVARRWGLGHLCPERSWEVWRGRWRKDAVGRPGVGSGMQRGQALGLGISGQAQDMRPPPPRPLLPRWLPAPGVVVLGGGRGAPQGSSSCSAWGHFPPRASRRALRTPVRVAQVPGQRFCAGLSSPAGLSRGLSARASCRELGAGGRIKLSRNGTGCARL